MEGAQLRQSHMPRFALALALALIALVAGVLAPSAIASSPSQDQYGSAIPSAGAGGNGSSSSTGGPSAGTGSETTIPVAGSSSSRHPSSGGASSSTSGGRSSHGDQAKKGGATKIRDTNPSSTSPRNASHSVPQIATDSAGSSWVPFFIAGLVALGAAGAFLVYRNRRRAAQP